MRDLQAVSPCAKKALYASAALLPCSTCMVVPKKVKNTKTSRQAGLKLLLAEMRLAVCGGVSNVRPKSRPVLGFGCRRASFLNGYAPLRDWLTIPLIPP